MSLFSCFGYRRDCARAARWQPRPPTTGLQRLLSFAGRCQLHSHSHEFAVGSPISGPATMAAIVGGAGIHTVLLLPVRRPYRCVGTAAWPGPCPRADERARPALPDFAKHLCSSHGFTQHQNLGTTTCPWPMGSPRFKPQAAPKPGRRLEALPVQNAPSTKSLQAPLRHAPL